ncbi:hypothetical protein QKU48_gp0199 [Fadolivirus algeromassiliense]|jgi:hypothetical protein|uniref:Uncharacterized protein n=1 Tax=Fadolivirus FV1/VV64 TaxID=3070911 RepID=A0A7D3V8K5_9VIRU|nr:hypothetical protein QKU48_gp0199 [Fadolivirus algeromassiliense]QKF93657.1 hypothetical protein Fadolivirus_1_199 [Fadolivirus FV1/VV64]
MPKKAITFEELCRSNGIKLYKVGMQSHNKKIQYCMAGDDILTLFHRKTKPKDLKPRTTYNGISLYTLHSVENMLKYELDNPNVIDYHIKLGWYKELEKKYKKQAIIIYKIVSAINRKGIWQYIIDGIPYTKPRPDYAFTELKLLLEVNERYHDKRNQLHDDYDRNELLKSLGWRIIPIYVDDLDFNLNDTIKYIRAMIDYLDDDITIDKIKKEFKDFADIEEFAEQLGLSIIKSFEGDPFRIPLKKALGTLGISMGTEKYNELMKLFNSLDDNCSNNEYNCGNTSDEDNVNNDDDEDEFPDVDDDDIPDVDDDKSTDTISDSNLDYTWNIEGRDYIIVGNDYLITRQCFAELAIKANTPQGKKISTQLHRLIEMITQLLKIIDKRRKSSIELIDDYKLNEALKSLQLKDTDIRLQRKQKQLAKEEERVCILTQMNKELVRDNTILEREMSTLKKIIVDKNRKIISLQNQLSNQRYENNNKLIGYYEDIVKMNKTTIISM